MEHTAWPQGMPTDLTVPPVGLDALLRGTAQAYGERAAIIDGDVRLSYVELADAAFRLAHGLRRAGIGAGDVVVIHVPNSVWVPIVYYGIVCSGAAAAPVNPAMPALALERQLTALQASAVITHPSCADRISAESRASLKLVSTLVDPQSDVEAQPWPGEVPFADLADAPIGEPITIAPDSLCHLQMTGGTTGLSKGVRVLHRNVIGSTAQAVLWRSGHRVVSDETGAVALEPVEGLASAAPLTPGQGGAAVSAPMFHGLALLGLTFNVSVGLTTELLRRFDPEVFLATIERNGCSALSGTPAMYHALVEHAEASSFDLSSVRLASSGGAPADETLLERMRKAFPSAQVIEGYGLSEATATLLSTPAMAGSAAPAGSVGVPLPGTRIELRDLTTGKPVADGESGEIWASGVQVTDGYQGDPELTSEQFQDGWLRTGDVGRRDESGIYYITGRSKDMVIYKGYNVYPRPLEDLLAAHPKVRQVAVTAEQADGVGEIPVAFVTVDQSGGLDGLADELMAFVAEQVAPYQRIRKVYVVETMPLSPAGKVLKRNLHEHYEQEASRG